jgi:LmbE family N-acetylglucosaminyl deacetylase
MLRVQFQANKQEGCKILCLGAHSDDIEIGCAGSLLKFIEEYNALTVRWVVFSAQADREEEARNSANTLLEKASDKIVVLKNFRDGFFPFIGADIKEYFEELKQTYKPDLIFTHYRGDLHQDHRCIAEITAETFRDHLILEYEIPKYDGDLGTPNVYVCLSEILCRKKVEHVLEYFPSQGKRRWFEAETFWSLLRLRGMESNSVSRYAEAFYCRKLILD